MMSSENLGFRVWKKVKKKKNCLSVEIYMKDEMKFEMGAKLGKVTNWRESLFREDDLLLRKFKRE